MGGVFSGRQFFSGLKRLQSNLYQNKLQNLFLIILPNYVFVAYLLPALFYYSSYISILSLFEIFILGFALISQDLQNKSH